MFLFVFLPSNKIYSSDSKHNVILITIQTFLYSKATDIKYIILNLIKTI